MIRRPVALLGAACLLAPALWWAGRLGFDGASRAFDASDPSEQLAQGLAPVAQFQQKGLLGWLAAATSDPGAKPLQSALLSAGILLGLPANQVGYELATAAFIIALMTVLQGSVVKSGGEAAGILFAGFALGSNIALQQALYGGHSWLGQTFIWLAAGVWVAEGPPVRPLARPFFFALALSSAVLSSYHMAPLAAALGLAWGGFLAAVALRERKLSVAPLAAFFLGAAALVGILEGGTFFLPKHHYWETLSWQFRAARDVPETFRDAGFYFLDLLRTCESPVFAAALILLLLAGAGSLLPRLRSEPELWPWVIVPATALAFAQAPTTIKLERTCLPAVVALFPLAALGGQRLLRLLPQRAQLPAALAAAAALIVSNLGQRRTTWAAFHAGPAIETAIAAQGGGGAPVVVGASLPYIYEPGREVRVSNMAGLRQAAAQGRRFVLVSYLSSWWWKEFIEGEDRFDIPVHRVYDSKTPYTPVPGIESTSFQIFSNEFQYHQIRAGELRFPVENRLYRIDDFLAAAGAQR